MHRACRYSDWIRRNSDAFPGAFLARIPFSARNTPRPSSYAHIVACLLVAPANRIIYPSRERESRFPTIYFFGESSSSYRNFRVILEGETCQNTTEISFRSRRSVRWGKSCCTAGILRFLLLFTEKDDWDWWILKRGLRVYFIKWSSW